MAEVRRDEDAAAAEAEESDSLESSDSDSGEESGDSEDSDSDSDSDSDDEEEDEGPSFYSKLVTKWSPTLAWLHAKSGTVGWIVASTFLVVVMPLAFETEREAMQMEQMAEQRKLAAQGQPGIPGVGGPAAAVLPKV
mmetsp:Transcript_180942/g.440306  ORF Transcript_180942/g.440306 Transcript_180942/m.440306 type:complete len:137 (-) Transcript_180942:102-512(-)